MGLLDAVLPAQLGPYSISDEERKRLLKHGLLSAGLTMMATPTGTGSPLMGITRGLLAGVETSRKGALDNFEAQYKLAKGNATPAELETFREMTKGMSAEDVKKATRIALGLDGRASNAGYGFDTIETADGRKRPQRRNPRTGTVEVLIGEQWIPLGDTPSAAPLNDPLPPQGPMDRGTAMSYVQQAEQASGQAFAPSARLQMIEDLMQGGRFDVAVPSGGLLADSAPPTMPNTGLLAPPTASLPGGLLGTPQMPAPTNPLSDDGRNPSSRRAPGGRDPFASRPAEESTLATERARNQAAREQMPYQTAQAGAEADARARAEALANAATAHAQGLTAGTVEASKQHGQDAAKEFATIQGKAQMATAENGNLMALRESLRHAHTGPGANLALGAKRAASLFGIDVEGLGEAEAARALSNRMAMALRNPAGGEGMPGAMSDADRNFLVQSIPNLESSPAGWRAMIDMRLALNASAIKQAQMAEQLRVKGVPVQDIPGIIRNYANENPIFRRPQKPAAAGVADLLSKYGVK